MINKHVGVQTSNATINNEGGATMIIDKVFQTAAERGIANYAKNSVMDRYRKGFTKKARVYVNKLIVSSTNERSLKIQAQDSSVLFETVPTETIGVRQSDLSVKAENYARRLLSVTCNIEDKLMLDILVSNGIYVEFDEKNARPVAAYGRTSNGTDLRIIGKYAKPQHPERLRHYQMLNYSPSDVKLTKWWAYEGTEEERLTILHELTKGASEIQLFDPINTGDTTKKIARIASMNTPSRLVTDDVKIGFYNDVFPTKEEDGLDGLGIVNAKKVKDYLGTNLAEGHFTGIGMQLRSRPIISKIFGVCTQNELFIKIATNLKGRGKLYLPKGCKIENLDILLDKNGVKLNGAVLNHETMTFTTAAKNELRLLDMPSRNPVKTSGQMLEKVVAANPVKGRAILETMLRKGLVEELVKRFEKEAKVPHLGEANYSLSKNGMPNFLLSIAPLAVHKDKGLAYTVIKQTFDSIKKSINKLAVAVEQSIFARAMADISYMLLGDSVIHFGEFYSNVDTEYAVFFKYPTMGIREYYYAKNIKNVLEKRLRKLAGQNEDRIETASLIYEFYQSLHQGIVAVPNSEILRNLLAGFDFDFDGVAMVWDATFLNLFANTKPYVVSIERTNPKTEEEEARKFLTGKGSRTIRNTAEMRNIPLNIQMITDTYKKQVLTDGKSIGQITNLNSTEIGLYLSMLYYIETGDTGRVEEFKGIVKKMLITSAGVGVPGKGTYIPMPSHKISENGVEMDNIIADDNFGLEMIRRIRETNLDSLSNILAILLDLNVLRRRQQEGTIDSSKDGLIMRIDLWADRYKAKSLIKFDYTLSSEDCMVTFDRDRVSPKTTVIQDIFSEVQDTLIKEVIAFNKAEFMPLYREAGFSQADFTRFAEAVQENSREFAHLSTLKYYYGVFNRVIMADIGRTEDEEMKKDLGDKLKSMREILSGMVNATVAELEDDAADELVMATSCYDVFKKTFKNTRQRFALNVEPKRYFRYMMNNTEGSVKVEAERFYGWIADEENGVIAELKDGYVNDRFASGSTETPFNGEVTILKRDGQLFAVRNIEVETDEVDNIPVIMKSVEGTLNEDDAVIFIKEDVAGFKEYKVYKLIVENGVTKGAQAVGRFNEKSMVKLSDLSSGSVNAYRVKGTFHDEHTVKINNKEDGYVFDVLFVKRYEA